MSSRKTSFRWRFSTSGFTACSFHKCMGRRAFPRGWPGPWSLLRRISVQGVGFQVFSHARMHPLVGREAFPSSGAARRRRDRPVSGSVSHSACQPPSARCCSCCIVEIIVETRPGIRTSAAASTVAQVTGLRLCGMVEEPPRASPPGSAEFADFGLRVQRNVSRDFPRVSRCKCPSELDSTIRSRFVCHGSRWQGRCSGPRRALSLAWGPRPAKSRKRADGAAKLQREVACAGSSNKSRAIAEQRHSRHPATMTPERSGQGLLHPGARHDGSCSMFVGKFRQHHNKSVQDPDASLLPARGAIAAWCPCQSRPGW